MGPKSRALKQREAASKKGMESRGRERTPDSTFGEIFSFTACYVILVKNPRLCTSIARAGDASHMSHTRYC
jgi:hypothetical protein